MGMPSARAAVAVGTVLLAVVACTRSDTAPVDQSAPAAPMTSAAAPTLEPPPVAAPAAPDFAAVPQLIDDAIAARQLPGAVVVVGHGGKVVFEKAYGVRKLDGDQGLDGKPAPAEPMTTDTIFDMASLTKPLATATAVMQLYEQGLVQLDDPMQNYLPDFNPSNDPQRASVTVRMLLTHFSGEAGEVDIRDSWGLDGASKAEGLHRALTAPLQLAPGEEFRYSDINYLLLGALIEQVTGEAEDVYVQRNVFAALGMRDTRFLPSAKACGPHEIRGAAIGWAPGAVAECPADSWSTDLLSRIAPTAIDEDGRAEPASNPDLDRLLRGTVHDTTARRMGGVAGHAGVFSTAQDVSSFAQALLDRLAGRPSEFPLTQATLELMTTPQQPGHSGEQLQAANAAVKFPPNYPAIEGQNLRGLGWDIDTFLSVPRGTIFPVGSFGHTGFTGTTLWMDPGSDTYVALLSNSIHVRGSRPIQKLRGEVATAVARALHLYGSG